MLLLLAESQQQQEKPKQDSDSISTDKTVSSNTEMQENKSSNTSQIPVPTASDINNSKLNTTLLYKKYDSILFNILFLHLRKRREKFTSPGREKPRQKADNHTG